MPSDESGQPNPLAGRLYVKPKAPNTGFKVPGPTSGSPRAGRASGVLKPRADVGRSRTLEPLAKKAKPSIFMEQGRGEDYMREKTPPLPAKQLPSIGTDASKGVALRGSHDEPFPMDAAHHGVPASPDNWEPPSDGTAYIGLAYALRQYPNSTEFVYLRRLDKDSTSYNPYALDVVPFAAVDPNDFYTMSVRGVTHYVNGGSADFTNLDQWEREYQLFNAMCTLNVFKRYRAWKGFSLWRKAVRRGKIGRVQKLLKKNLFLLNDVFQTSLLCTRSLCFNLSQDDQRAMVKQELQTFSEETVETVSTACTRALELLEERLNGFYTKENEGDPTATMMHSPRSSSITASVPGKAGGKDANNYSYTIAAARRSEQRKLLCFVKLADYMICDTLHNLLIDSVSDILTVTAPPPEPEVVMDEEAAAAEAEAAAAKAEEEAKKKAEGKPEAKTDKEKEEEEKNKPPEKVPLYEIEVLLADGQLVFAPSPDEFQEKMDEVVGGFVDTLCTVTRLLAQENLMSQVVEQGTEVEMGSTLAELIEDEVHQNLVGEVKYSLAVAFDAAEECKQTFLPHQLICAENDKRDAAVLKSEYSAGERTLESFREDIKEFKKQTTDIEELPLNTDEGIVRINSQQLKETFLPSPKMCLDQIFKILPELGAERYGTFISEVHEGSTRLNATINTVEDFVEQLVALEELKEKQKKFNDQLLEITNLYEVIDEFTIPVSEMDYAAYQTLNTDFSALKTSMEEVEMQKDDYVSRFSQELEAQVEVINKEAVAIRTAAQHEMILDEKSDGDVVVAYVTDLREKLKVQETGAKRIQKYQKLFKVMESKYDELDETVGDVDLKEMLWQGKREWADLTEEWGEMKFEDIDITNMEEKVGRFYKQVMKAERGLPSNKVVPEQKDKVEEFKGTIPVIASLRNKNLKERHWDKVEEIIGRPIVRDGNFTLNSLMALKVMDFAEEIGIVSTEATQEGVLEELLAKVQAKWADVEFSVLSYKESKDVFILGGVDEVMVTLEDSMVTMATILSSRYVAGIRTEVEKMEKALNLFSETLDEWLAVQKGWMYLESIFSAPDIQRQLPAEAKAFFQVDKQLKDIMRRTKNVQAVQPHMSKCFDGIRLLDFGDDPKSIDIFAMISGEQEYVSLGKNLKARGNVEQWLSAVEAAMQASLKKFAKSAFQDYTKTWVQKRIRENLNATQETKDYVYGLFEEYIDEGIKFLRRNTREAIPSVDINLVTSTTFLFEALVQEKRGINFSKPPEELHPQLGKLFTFAYMWGMGGNMLSAGWDYWDEFVRDLFPKLVMFPGGGTVFDYYIDMKSETFDCKEWSTVVPDFVYDSKTPYFEMLVPTMDTVRYAFLLEILLEVQKSALFTGDTGVGKSVIVASSLSNLTEPAGLVPVTINFSAQTNAIDTQLLIESKLEKKRKTRFGAPYGKKIVIFVDDVNMPARETYGAQPPIELLRQFQDFRGFYDRKKLFWKDIEDMTIVSACAPPGGGRQELTPRFVRHFNMFCVPPPSEQCTKTILSSILGGFLGDGFSKEFATLLKPIVDSSMERYFLNMLVELLSKNFDGSYTYEEMFEEREIVFGDFIKIGLEREERKYEEVPDFEKMTKFLRRLFDFDKDNIPEKVIKSLKKYVDNPIYTPDQVAKQSNAAKSLCMWSRAMDVYHRVAKVVEPKRQALREAEGVLADANKVLKGKQDELAAVIARVQELENQLKQAEENQQSLAEQADTTAKRLQRAGKLTSALADEQVRWKETAESIGVATKLLVGDVFLGSGCISYYGAFTGVYRDELVTMWVSRCKEVGIPVSEECTLRATLSNPFTEWNFLLRGAPAVMPDGGPSNPAPDRFNEQKWKEIIHLSENVAAFGNLVKSMTSDIDSWLDWIDNSEPHAHRPPEVLIDPKAEGEEPGQLNEFHHLMLVKVFREEKVTMAASMYVGAKLGKEFVESKPWSLTEEVIPWEALSYVIGQINYGGRVTDDLDRRCLLSILGQYVLKDVLGDAYRFSKSGKYYAPTEGSLAEKLEYIAQLPAEEAPEVFGMHENANISFQLRDAKTLMDTVLSIQPRLVAAAGAKSPEDVVLDLAAELFGGLSEKPMTNEEAHESTFALGADGMLTSLAVVLSQEMERFNKLLKQMRSTLQLLQKAVKGLVVMSDDLELMFNSLLNNQVPGLWGKVAYPCLKPMASWIIDYHRRVEFFESWIANGNPKCYWLPGFFFPQGFLTGCLQAHARKYAMPIDTLNFDFSVTLMSDADEVEAGPEDGIYIDGLFVDNARWNMAEQWLDESEPGVMQSPLPVVHFLPAQKPLENLFKPEKMDEYQTPLYKTSIRAGILSTTGQSTNFVLCVLLPIREGTGPDFWVLQGAALLCMLDT
eukprot:gene3966-4937_t